MKFNHKFILCFFFFLLNISLFADTALANCVLDVRTQTDYTTEHVDIAINIPILELEQKLPDTFKDKATKIYVYGKSETQIQKAMDIFNKLGYTNVESIGTLENARDFAINLQRNEAAKAKLESEKAKPKK